MTTETGKTRTAIGLMSGTSMDGIDAAMLATDGQTRIEPGPRLSRPYDAAFRARLREALEVAAECASRAEAQSRLASVEAELTRRHVEAVTALIETAGRSAADIDVIGFHGQTVLHRPERRLTVQLGDGAALASATGIRVVGDFRLADVDAGGEGAPFAPAYHRALAMRSDTLPQVVVNIGGVANVTWVGADGTPVAFDTGPGNALLDDWIALQTGRAFDQGGEIASRGTCDATALEELLDHAFFRRPAPKSLDRNDFSLDPVRNLTLEDAAATLVEFTAATVALAADQVPEDPKRWVVCGGGRHNAAIMARLRARVAVPVLTAEDAGWRGDDVEAEAFAYLAVRSLDGEPLSWPTTTGVPRPMPGGRLHTPRNLAA